jgi:hypothetical protein
VPSTNTGKSIKSQSRKAPGTAISTSAMTVGLMVSSPWRARLLGFLGQQIDAFKAGEPHAVGPRELDHMVVPFEAEKAAPRFVGTNRSELE